MRQRNGWEVSAVLNVVACGASSWVAGSSPAMTGKGDEPGFRSDFQRDADFNDLRQRQVEMGRGHLGVAAHEGEKALAPRRHAAARGGDDRLAADEIGDLARIELWTAPGGDGGDEGPGNVRRLHEAETERDPGDALGHRLDR